MSNHPAPGPLAANEVLIRRVFDAPRELVFRAWTDPRSLPRWHAPQGCTIEYQRLDIRPGGAFHSCIRMPDGHECWCKGTYREVVPHERIVYTLEIADALANSVEPVDAGMDPDWPRQTVVTVTFADEGGKTVLTLRQTVDERLARQTGAHPSWLSMLDRLAAQLAEV